MTITQSYITTPENANYNSKKSKEFNFFDTNNTNFVQTRGKNKYDIKISPDLKAAFISKQDWRVKVFDSLSDAVADIDSLWNFSNSKWINTEIKKTIAENKLKEVKQSNEEQNHVADRDLENNARREISTNKDMNALPDTETSIKAANWEMYDLTIIWSNGKTFFKSKQDWRLKMFDSYEDAIADINSLWKFSWDKKINPSNATKEQARLDKNKSSELALKDYTNTATNMVNREDMPTIDATKVRTAEDAKKAVLENMARWIITFNWMPGQIESEGLSTNTYNFNWNASNLRSIAKQYWMDEIVNDSDWVKLYILMNEEMRTWKRYTVDTLPIMNNFNY